MRMFSEKVNPTLSNSSPNIIRVKDYQEIFFDVFEIEINKKNFVCEKITEYDNNPVVLVPLEEEDRIIKVPFMLCRGDFDIIYNENFLVDLIKVEENPEDGDIFDEAVEDIEDEVERDPEYREALLQEKVERAKIEARENIEKYQKEKEKELKRRFLKEQEEKEKALREYLQNSKEELINEFFKITEHFKGDLLSEHEDKGEEILKKVDEINEDFQRDLESEISEEVSKSLSILDEKYEQIFQIFSNRETNLEHSLEECNKIIEELENRTQRQINKALSRIGNSDKKIINLDERISESEESVKRFVDEELETIHEMVSTHDEKTKKELLGLLDESKKNILEEVKRIKNEPELDYVLESKEGKKTAKNKKDAEKSFEKKISDLNSRLTDEVAKLKKYAMYSGGGGTVAVQYQDGGVMNGDLTIHGTLSANNYAGIDTSITSDTTSDGTANLSLSSLSLDTPLPLASGGTGADTAAAARTNLGLGTGDDILVDTLSVPYGSANPNMGWPKINLGGGVQHAFGMYASNSSSLTFVGSNARIVNFNRLSGPEIKIAGNGAFVWASGMWNAEAVADTGLSRISPTSIAIGNGSAGNASGSLTLANLTASGDIEATDATKGVILKSPDGTRYRITVANDGTLTTTAV